MNIFIFLIPLLLLIGTGESDVKCFAEITARKSERGEAEKTKGQAFFASEELIFHANAGNFGGKDSVVSAEIKRVTLDLSPSEGIGREMLGGLQGELEDAKLAPKEDFSIDLYASDAQDIDCMWVDGTWSVDAHSNPQVPACKMYKKTVTAQEKKDGFISCKDAPVNKFNGQSARENCCECGAGVDAKVQEQQYGGTKLKIRTLPVNEYDRRHESSPNKGTGPLHGEGNATSRVTWPDWTCHKKCVMDFDKDRNDCSRCALINSGFGPATYINKEEVRVPLKYLGLGKHNLKFALEAKLQSGKIATCVSNVVIFNVVPKPSFIKVTHKGGEITDKVTKEGVGFTVKLSRASVKGTIYFMDKTKEGESVKYALAAKNPFTDENWHGSTTCKKFKTYWKCKFKAKPHRFKTMCAKVTPEEIAMHRQFGGQESAMQLQLGAGAICDPANSLCPISKNKTMESGAFAFVLFLNDGFHTTYGPNNGKGGGLGHVKWGNGATWNKQMCPCETSNRTKGLRIHASRRGMVVLPKSSKNPCICQEECRNCFLKKECTEWDKLTFPEQNALKFSVKGFTWESETKKCTCYAEVKKMKKDSDNPMNVSGYA